MNKKIIGLYGTANAGKSTSIKKVYAILTSQYSFKEIGDSIKDYDIRVILEINGIKIGIESQGDPNSRLNESLELFIKTSCEIIICATRTRGMTVDWVEAKRPLYEVEWKAKECITETNQQETSNLKIAKDIVTAIKKYL